MLFSSPIFIFLFLPIVLLLYFTIRRDLRNTLLLIASLIFYAWGEKLATLVILLSLVFNYFFALIIEKTLSRDKVTPKLVLLITVIFNIGFLLFFKYANFFISSLIHIFPFIRLNGLYLSPIHLPIGISFFTFHALSYVIDVYRKQCSAQTNPINLGLYFSFFPQLIAGPIIRYHDVAEQLTKRTIDNEIFVSGIKRFVVGLGKKVLIANTVALVADQIFAIPVHQLTVGLSWLGIVCYTLQIYFDFSGYSDMAIGLGRMFGFRFLENFNYPYISKSIKEFWRRWHISLSNWFRDYLYIPLGGNRVSQLRTYFNLLTVFFLCGLWHGASWTFVVWGLYHGLFLVLERTKFGKFIDFLWLPLRYCYTILVVMIGWIFFRADSFTYAFGFLQAMFGFAKGTEKEYFLAYINREILIAILAGIIGSIPIFPWISKYYHSKINTIKRAKIGFLMESSYLIILVLCLSLIFFASVMSLASNTYNPFIYFRF